MQTLLDKHIYPFLFAVYPVLALLGSNIEEIKIYPAFRVLLVSILISAVIYFSLVRMIKDRDKAALVTSLVLILFFSYGHIYNLFKSSEKWGSIFGRHRILLSIWIILVIAGVLFILRKNAGKKSLNRFLNVIAITAVVIPIIQISTYGVSNFSSGLSTPANYGTQNVLSLRPNELSPDIYYVILDAYARDDTLLEDFKLDNSQFLTQLEDIGFFVGYCSQSNYAQTALSLATSLNLNYLEALGDQYTPGSTTRVGIRELIQDSKVRNLLENLGYLVVSFETGFKITQWEDADIYKSPRKGIQGDSQFFGGINDFEVLLLRNSLVRIVIDGSVLLPQFLQPDLDNPKRVHHERVHYVIDQLGQLPDIPGPKFVFAHLVIPHGPFVFEANGDFVEYDKLYHPGYKDQITFINHQLAPILQEIIRNSDPKPIIILQADHGAVRSAPDKRMHILNAYFLPGDGEELVYEGISPVNTFRIIFNRYFGGNYDLLEDVSYFSTYNHPYKFTLIPDNRLGCK
ncbi:hypothetical protein ACFLUC_02290 [Chloroflexota bacterium]